MNLVVDIGNTLTKKALFSNNEVTEYEKSSDIPDANWFENLMKELFLPPEY
jgi:pantothenate kinase type III